MKIPTICRYCGSVIRLAPARKIYGASTDRLGLAGENIYLCQNCNARVGCHKGTNRPLGVGQGLKLRCLIHVAAKKRDDLAQQGGGNQGEGRGEPGPDA